jgi:hypothetical protein
MRQTVAIGVIKSVVFKEITQKGAAKIGAPKGGGGGKK